MEDNRQKNYNLSADIYFFKKFKVVSKNIVNFTVNNKHYHFL